VLAECDTCKELAWWCMTIIPAQEERQENWEFKANPGKVSKILSQEQNIKGMGMAQEVEHLPSMCEILDSTPSTPPYSTKRRCSASSVPPSPVWTRVCLSLVYRVPNWRAVPRPQWAESMWPQVLGFDAKANLGYLSLGREDWICVCVCVCACYVVSICQVRMSLELYNGKLDACWWQLKESRVVCLLYLPLGVSVFP
jgi:hypothetical protein